LVPPPAPLRIGGTSVIPTSSIPLVVSEEEGHIVFEVPVQSQRKDIPVDKFQVHITVGRPGCLVEHVADARPRASG